MLYPKDYTRENPYLNLYIILRDNDRMRIQNFPDILGEWFEITECKLTKPSANFYVSVSKHDPRLLLKSVEKSSL